MKWITSITSSAGRQLTDQFFCHAPAQSSTYAYCWVYHRLYLCARSQWVLHDWTGHSWSRTRCTTWTNKTITVADVAAVAAVAAFEPLGSCLLIGSPPVIWQYHLLVAGIQFILDAEDKTTDYTRTDTDRTHLHIPVLFLHKPSWLYLRRFSPLSLKAKQKRIR